MLKYAGFSSHSHFTLISPINKTYILKDMNERVGVQPAEPTVSVSALPEVVLCTLKLMNEE